MDLSPDAGRFRRAYGQLTALLARGLGCAVSRAKVDPEVGPGNLGARIHAGRAGEHPRVIQHRLGHSTARLPLELYAHVSEAADRDAAAHLDTLFTGTAAESGIGSGQA